MSPATFSPASRFRFRTHVLVQTDLDPAILLDTLSGRYYEANAVAHRLIIGIRSGQTVNEICRAIVQEFAVTDTEARADLEAVLTHWMASNWLDSEP